MYYFTSLLQKHLATIVQIIISLQKCKALKDHVDQWQNMVLEVWLIFWKRYKRYSMTCRVHDNQVTAHQTDMVGETVIDCRPSVLPVSMPLSALSPRTADNAREISGFKPPQETGQSIMDMDTNEITINRIVGFQWDEPGTDVEDELPTPTSSPVQNIAPVIPPTEIVDLFDRGDGFDLDLAKVLLDISVMPALISPIEESEVSTKSI